MAEKCTQTTTVCEYTKEKIAQKVGNILKRPQICHNVA